MNRKQDLKDFTGRAQGDGGSDRAIRGTEALCGIGTIPPSLCFTDEEISARIAGMIAPADCPSEIAVVYQTIDHLHQACPKHSGDWYFSGDYPTPGGNRLVNRAFVEWYEKRFNP